MLQHIRLLALFLALASTLATLISGKILWPAATVVSVALVLHAKSIISALRSAGPLRWAWVYFAFVCGLSALITPFPETTYPQVLRTLLGFACSLVIFVGLPKNSSHIVFGLMTLLGMGFSVLTPLLVGYSASPGAAIITSQAWFSQTGLAMRSYINDNVNPNVLGGVIAYLLPLLLAGIVFYKPWRVRLMLVPAVLLMLGALWFSNSRGAMAGVAVAIWVLMTLRKPALGMALAGLAMLVLAYVLWYYGPTIFTPFLTLGGAKEGPEHRMELWSRAWYIIQDFMFTGIGMGTFEQVVDLLYPLILSVSVPHAHNIILQIAVDLGVPGLIAWLCILSSVLRACARVLWRGSRDDAYVLAAGFLAAQVVLLTHGMVDAVLWGMIRTAPLVWIMWGFALNLERMQQAEEVAPSVRA